MLKSRVGVGMPHNQPLLQHTSSSLILSLLSQGNLIHPMSAGTFSFAESVVPSMTVGCGVAVRRRSSGHRMEDYRSRHMESNQKQIDSRL